MPRKRKPDGSPPASTRKSTKAVADWREALYYLHGEVYTENDVRSASHAAAHTAQRRALTAARALDSRMQLTVWEGTWVQSSDGLPTLQDFAASTNSFKLSTRDFLDTGVRLEELSPIGRSGKFSGNYKIIQGEVSHKYSDIAHKIVVMDHAATCSLVAERGTSEFGEFVSLGRLVFGARGSPCSLTLARRYITDDDPRAHQSPWQTLFRIASKARGQREKQDFVPQAPAPWLLLSTSGST